MYDFMHISDQTFSQADRTIDKAYGVSSECAVGDGTPLCVQYSVPPGVF